MSRHTQVADVMATARSSSTAPVALHDGPAQVDQPWVWPVRQRVQHHRDDHVSADLAERNKFGVSETMLAMV
jgi:hypothetical protein